MSKGIKNTVGNSTYEKIKNSVEATDKVLTSEEEENAEARVSRKVEQKVRPTRKKVYEQIVSSKIPQDVIDLFAKDDYEVRWVRLKLGGEEDLSNLGRREREGYEFVTADELPENFLNSLKIYDGKTRQGLITSGDLVLMKVDTELRKSREEFFKTKTDKEVDAANIWNTSRKRGLIDTGSKSSVSVGKEPTFQ